MKISRVETFILTNQLEGSFFFSQWEYSERKICIVKITADNGLCGWGEGYGPANIIQAGIHHLKPIIIGKSPIEQETIWFEMYRKTLDFARRGVLTAALSAIDVALWDLKGKFFDLPISVLLGGQNRQKVVPDRVPNQALILTAFLDRPWAGPCGSNTINTISCAMWAHTQKVRFWSHFRPPFGAFLALVGGF